MGDPQEVPCCIPLFAEIVRAIEKVVYYFLRSGVGWGAVRAVIGALRMGRGGVMRRRVEARSVGCGLGRWRKEGGDRALRMGVTGGVMRRRVEASILFFCRNDVRIGTPLGQVMVALRMGVTGGVMRRRVEARSVGCRLGRWRKEGGDRALRMAWRGGVMRRGVEARWWECEARRWRKEGSDGALRMGVAGGVMRASAWRLGGGVRAGALEEGGA
ncbi:hypothetical protein H5410_064833 [Solanum commersonii]|uniref:Uncharacterized protein n=1 Tax=Solanum commersonii TaxID=4109 RepID=A0A9J5VYB4_SOLCO|nr:hypothetical protein H5410_064833 [Solanum commersonii]